jgi:Tfp pilus assembly protein PilO
MKSHPKTRHGSWPVTLSLAAAGILYLAFSFFPTSRAISQVREEIRTTENVISQSASLALSLSQTEAELKRTKEYTGAVRQRLISRSALSALIGRISREADMAGARTTRIEPQPAAEFETLRVVPVIYKANGGFVEISRLLTGLEGLPEPVWLEDVQLTAARESGQNVECDLTLAVFAGRSESSD